MHSPNDVCYGTTTIDIPSAEGIADAGSTGTFVVPNAPVINVRPTTNPIKITMPDGDTIESTHTCNLNIPWMPEEMTRAHIVPGLAHSSLISIKQMVDHGAKVVYDKKEC